MILMNDFKAEPAELKAAELTAAQTVLESGWYVLGKQVADFEEDWARACGAQHAVGVGNGMDAIEIALRCLDIGPGDEVITTPMTAFATVLAILRAGATPVLADIDAASGLLDPASVARCLSPCSKAVLPVHLYGQIADMDVWMPFCTEHQLALVEDCAQAHLAAWNGQRAGTFGRAGAYSFYPTKNLGAPGDAGALITNDAAIAERARVLRNYGQSERYHHPQLGLNSRLDEMQAAILKVRLAWLEAFTARRRAVAAAYQAGIANPLVQPLPAPAVAERHVHHLFVVVSVERERLQAHLLAAGVQSLIHYPVPVHRQKPCRDFRCDPQGLLQAEQHAATCLSLPCHPGLADAEVDRVIEIVNAFR